MPAELPNHPGPPNSSGAALPHASSPCGEMVVVTTPDGLPVGLRIAQNQMAVSLDVLAARVLALCRLAAVSAGVTRRDQLSGDGVCPEVLDALAMPDRQALLAAEDAADRLFVEAMAR